MRNAKIVCTLGPASDDRRTIRELADAGMSVARLNASHGTVEDRAELIDLVREIDETTDDPLAVMLDTQGPEIRTAPLEEPTELETGSRVRFVEGEDATPQQVGLSNPITGVEPGDRVLLDDGRIETTVEELEGDTVIARVESGGPLPGRKGVNVPGVELDLEVVTEKDRRDLQLAAEKEVDFVAASFVRDAEDVYEVGATLEEFGDPLPIVSKIERAGAVENLQGIVEASYGVMVARGDLGVECPMEDVPMIQKRIIRACRDAGAPVITATEMLDSMVHSRRPTRAEASDVANAVLDGTDAVMLSGETAIGDHPVRVVETMGSIVRQVERSTEYDELRESRVPAPSDSRTEALARAARYLARDLDASAVVAASESGYTARKMAKYRPGVPVIASTPTERVRRQLALSWGVSAQYAPFTDEGPNAVIDNAVNAALDSGVADSGDTVVVLSGMMSEIEGAGTTNMLKVHVAAETLETGTGVVSGRTSGPVVHTEDGDLAGVEPGAILSLPAGFDGEFTGELSRVGAIVDARSGMTGYPAMIARELGIPMVSGADLTEVPDGTTVTVDAERGVIYEGELASPTERREIDAPDWAGGR
ncbi:pyruvate kinase [Halalkalicoccus jeotgali]|uniref:Pyruvate kinase n=1 Tax=Halalkalicoccus jeotgali (strain DSM 18796 / CECT 7217 / JCM 14584 / KCTC 4019 / B3) TaxID=795797 RepID=D8J7J0_HALJB|nr:pyruvate kinase [Halalkalicoccus jeotgali]ADJ16010.1 pyruvate kinase [Halalkalicoccus jeotgali B3]ELY38106.1 pyruvate kinase [Halalkalicoccus jeotgali B3]